VEDKDGLGLGWDGFKVCSSHSVGIVHSIQENTKTRVVESVDAATGGDNLASETSVNNPC
jgi:hypothetical protein